MKYYHLVTRIPMTEGQIIDFSGENKNRSYIKHKLLANRLDECQNKWYNIIESKNAIQQG